MHVKIETWLDNEIRFLLIDGEWWALGKDVAMALELKDATEVANMVDEDEKIIIKRSMFENRSLSGLEIPNRGLIGINEFGIYEAIHNSRKPEAKQFKKWVKQILRNLRQLIGLEGFEVFRMLDKEHQKEAMRAFQPKNKKDYMVLNKMANAAVSKHFGYEKPLKKEEMTGEMLQERQPILDGFVSLTNLTGSKGQANKLMKEILKIS